jgi:tetratricopeptide (TPR) repeat protein
MVASFYAELDRFAEARTLFEDALGTYRRVFGEQSMQTANAMQYYARTLLTTGPEERRNEHAAEALGLAEHACALIGKGTPGTWNYFNTFALAQHLTGDTEKAIETQKRSLVLLPEEAASRWEYEGRLATYYRSVGRVDDAARVARQRLETLRRLLERGGETPKVLNAYARDLLTIDTPDLRDPAAALPLAERACALAEERGTYGRWKYLDTLALAQHQTGDTAKAIETQRRALGLLPPDYHQQRKEFEQSLAEYQAALAAKPALQP